MNLYALKWLADLVFTGLVKMLGNMAKDEFYIKYER